MIPFVKICGLQNPEDAYFSAKAGADMIGIIQYPPSRRHVSLEIAVEIALAVKEGGAKLAVVVVDPSSDFLSQILESLEIDLLQTYSPLEIHFPEEKGIIYVNQPAKKLRLGKDFHLFDHPMGGQGIPLNWSEISPPKEGRWILAGGLRPDNVQTAISLLHPHGVDVSSGIETGGKKDLEKIRTFIETVREYA